MIYLHRNQGRYFLFLSAFLASTKVVRIPELILLIRVSIYNKLIAYHTIDTAQLFLKTNEI